MAASGDLAQQVIERLRFDDAGLIPAIAQAHETREVLMLAWMNADSVRETLATGRVCYWSRSRQRLWRKANPRATRSGWWRCASTATATPCCCWWSRPAPPATPTAPIASSTPCRAMRSG